VGLKAERDKVLNIHDHPAFIQEGNERGSGVFFIQNERRSSFSYTKSIPSSLPSFCLNINPGLFRFRADHFRSDFCFLDFQLQIMLGGVLGNEPGREAKEAEKKKRKEEKAFPEGNRFLRSRFLWEVLLSPSRSFRCINNP